MPNQLAEHLPSQDFDADCARNSDCQKKIYVLRITLANTIFFTLCGMLVFGIKSSKDPRAMVQNGLWPLKFILWLGILVPFPTTQSTTQHTTHPPDHRPFNP